MKKPMISPYNDPNSLFRPTSAKENWNKTHCYRGHEFTEENTYRDVNQHRHCRTCNRDNQQKWRNDQARIKAEGPSRLRIERFWARVDQTDTCWLWTGPLHPLGYARVRWFLKTRGVHEIAYEITYGPVPAGLEIDHLCRVRHCCNPEHLEAVTHQENIQRGARARRDPLMCRNGHVRGTGTTARNGQCRICRNEQQARWMADPTNRARANQSQAEQHRLKRKQQREAGTTPKRIRRRPKPAPVPRNPALTLVERKEERRRKREERLRYLQS